MKKLLDLTENIKYSFDYKETHAMLIEKTRETVDKLKIDDEEFYIRVFMKLLKQHYENAELVEDAANCRDFIKFLKNPLLTNNVYIARFSKTRDIEIYDRDGRVLLETLDMHT